MPNYRRVWPKDHAPHLICLSGKRIIVTKKNPRQSTHAWGSE